MRRSCLIGTCLLALFTLALIASPPAGHAGPFDRIKNKLGEKAGQKTDKAVDKAADKAEDAVTGKDKAKSGEADQGGDAAKAGDAAGSGEAAKAGGAAGGAGPQVAAVSTKFDFVPGDNVMLADDFTQDDLGEFPAKWKLVSGTLETAEMGGERWLRLASEMGRIRPRLPGLTQLPEFWTLEFDYSLADADWASFTVEGIGKDDGDAWYVEFPQAGGTAADFWTGSISSRTPFENVSKMGGRHHVMIMARGPALKVYVDRQRMVNVPEIDPRSGPPRELQVQMRFPTAKPMITNVRFAEGCRPAKDMLAEGRFVTYGIHFDTGSDVVLPESAPVLRQVAAYLQANPAVKLKITGHTDNVGTAASNLDLSRRRAAAVAKVLSDQFAIAADRFSTDGKGDAQALAGNDKPEGRAMNRRVEFTKL